MAKGKHKNLTNRNQDHSPSSENSTAILPSPGHPNRPKKLDPDLKAYLMMMVEDIKKNLNNSLKEIQENNAKQVEDIKEEDQLSLKELQENTTKQVTELNKTIQDLKREVDTIKKTQSEAMLEIEKLERNLEP
jgi:septal ring factor EnvC (AmiA/AmiB activator)